MSLPSLPRLEGVSLAILAEELGTPFYAYSKKALLAPFLELTRGLAPLGDPLICFAVKSCSNLSILRVLAAQGAGMDLVSGGELARAVEAGTPAERIVFSGVGKSRGEMREALLTGKDGILAFNVESIEELRALGEEAGAQGRIARVSLRFNPDVDPKTHPYIATGLHDNKFGLDRRALLEAAAECAKLPHLRLNGLSIHIGSQLTSLAPLSQAFRSLRAVIPEVEERSGRKLDHVDLGGGLGIRYRKEKPPSIAAYCALVLRHFGPRSGLPRPLRVLVEPGRLISGAAGVLVTRVVYRKKQGKRRFLICDAGMNDLVRPALYDGYHEVVSVEPLGRNGAKAVLTDVVGPVCESSDFLAKGRRLAAELPEGALLAVLNAGAYGFSMSSNYNTRPRPPEVLVDGSSSRVIRRRETVNDLLAAERL
ncbi:MAG: diaminopimelate decarboxylase [Bdellovibrionales bacterium]|nr:diaminopimelate decarboxylase [Bdellovibrionales bacterium]